MFIAIVGLMPTEFFLYQPDYEAVSAQQQEVIDYFSAHNITLYKSTWMANISFGEVEILEDIPTTEHQLELHFVDQGVGLDFLQLRHAFPSPLGAWWLWWHSLPLTAEYATRAGFVYGSSEMYGGTRYTDPIFKSHLVALETSENSSLLEAYCEHLTINMVFFPINSSYTLEESFDAGMLTFYSSYEVDWDAMKPSAFTLISQLIFFQNPDLGLPSPLDEIVGYGFSIGFSVAISIIIYTIVTRLIPIITGGIES